MSSRGDIKEEKVRRKLSTNSESVHGVGGRWYLNESSNHINCPRFNDPTMDIELDQLPASIRNYIPMTLWWVSLCTSCSVVPPITLGASFAAQPRPPLYRVAMTSRYATINTTKAGPFFFFFSLTPNSGVDMFSKMIPAELDSPA